MAVVTPSVLMRLTQPTFRRHEVRTQLRDQFIVGSGSREDVQPLYCFPVDDVVRLCFYLSASLVDHTQVQ
jgi:hypothetical protein